MKTIIALMGVSKRGKSPTIQLVEDHLNTIGYTDRIHRTKERSEDPAVIIDFEAIYQNPTTLKKIGLCSVGDNEELVSKGVVVELIEQGKCDICICAVRSSGATHTVLESVSGYTTLYYPKTFEGQIARQREVNRMDALQLLEIARRME